MGPLTAEQNEFFCKNPRFIGMKFPDVVNPETLEKRYVGKLSSKALSLMNGLLRIDPAQRLTGLEALAHPYFDGIRDPEVERLVQGVVARPIVSSHGGRVVNSRSRTGLRNQVILASLRFMCDRENLQLTQDKGRISGR